MRYSLLTILRLSHYTLTVNQIIIEEHTEMMMIQPVREMIVLGEADMLPISRRE